MMSITIEIRKQTNDVAEIDITQAGVTYAWRVGNVPDTGVQAWLDDQAGALWRQASARGEVRPETERVRLTRDEALRYFRNQLAAAAGDGPTLLALYQDARDYEQRHPVLTDTMLSLRTIRETADGLNIILTTNQGRAKYIQMFIVALTLWQ